MLISRHMRTERGRWREKVRRWKKEVDQAESGLGDSKLSATDLVGDRPRFNPSQEYITKIALQVIHLEQNILTKHDLTTRKRARVERELGFLKRILQGDTTS